MKHWYIIWEIFQLLRFLFRRSAEWSESQDNLLDLTFVKDLGTINLPDAKHAVAFFSTRAGTAEK